MRFDSTLPDDTLNISDGSPVHDAILLVLGVVGAVIGITALLAVTIEWLVPLVPPSLEVRLFSFVSDTFTSEDPQDADTDLDPNASRVQEIIDRLAVHWTDSPYPRFHAFVVDDPLPNAFALPGGAIAVTRGLLDRVETENELAFVLGHELGHFAGRDHLRGIGRALVISIALQGLGVSGGQVESLASMASDFSARHFDREQESAADLIGARLVVGEYGHAAGLRGVFDRVLVDPDRGPDQAEASASLDQLASYFSTHPLGPDRIEALESFIAASGWSEVGTQIPWIPIEFREDEAIPEARSDSSEPH